MSATIDTLGEIYKHRKDQASSQQRDLRRNPKTAPASKLGDEGDDQKYSDMQSVEQSQMAKTSNMFLYKTLDTR